MSTLRALVSAFTAATLLTQTALTERAQCDSMDHGSPGMTHELTVAHPIDGPSSSECDHQSTDEQRRDDSCLRMATCATVSATVAPALALARPEHHARVRGVNQSLRSLVIPPDPPPPKL